MTIPRIAVEKITNLILLDSREMPYIDLIYVGVGKEGVDRSLYWQFPNHCKMRTT